MRATASDGPLGCALLPLTAAIAGNISMRAYIQYEVAATKQQLHGTWPCVYDSPQELQLLSSANELAHSLGLRAPAAMTLTQLQADCAKHEQAHWLRHWHGKPPQHVQRPLSEIRQQATSNPNPNPNLNPDRIRPTCHSSTRPMYHARIPPLNSTRHGSRSSRPMCHAPRVTPHLAYVHCNISQRYAAPSPHPHPHPPTFLVAPISQRGDIRHMERSGGAWWRVGSRRLRVRPPHTRTRAARRLRSAEQSLRRCRVSTNDHSGASRWLGPDVRGGGGGGWSEGIRRAARTEAWTAARAYEQASSVCGDLISI